MLVLCRKINESIVIGENIRVTISSIRGQQIRLAIEAPPDVLIIREELIRANEAGREQDHPPRWPNGATKRIIPNSARERPGGHSAPIAKHPTRR